MTALEQAALDYIAAWNELRMFAGKAEIPAYTVAVDAAFHDLILAAGYPCECDNGTCPRSVT